jgi:hypothetical protein
VEEVFLGLKRVMLHREPEGFEVTRPRREVKDPVLILTIGGG